jgi:AraC family transcriptional regulator, transcriptional activator of pobA
MDQFFHISNFSTDDAMRVASSPNEPHVHDFEELLVGVQGVIEHFIDFKAHQFKAPFISFIARGKVHRIKPMPDEGTCNIWVLRFSSDFLPETLFQLYALYNEHANIIMQKGDCFNQLVVISELINGEMKQPEPKLNVIRDLLRSLFTMIEAQREKYQQTDQETPKIQSVTFGNFLKILEENFRRPEGVSFYADKLFMSPRNLNLICQNIINKSVSDLIEARKLTEAKNLLIYTDKSISEIGFDIGYNEKSYFTNVFRKRTGMPPGEFRTSMRKIIS